MLGTLLFTLAGPAAGGPRGRAVRGAEGSTVCSTLSERHLRRTIKFNGSIYRGNAHTCFLLKAHTTHTSALELCAQLVSGLQVGLSDVEGGGGNEARDLHGRGHG